MSTKIFNAYKVKQRDQVWRVLADIRERGEREVVQRLDKYYRTFVDNIDPEGEAYKTEREKDLKGDHPEASTRLHIAQTALREGFKKSATSMQRDFYDPDVSVALTWHETGFYLRAFCDNVSLLGGSLDFLKDHPDLEDFHFQDQVDPPDDIPYDEYRARGRIWDEMSVPPGSGILKNQLILEISSWASFWRLDPWLEIAREFHRSPPTFPIREAVLARRLGELDAIAEVTAEPGRITGRTKAGVPIIIQKRGRRQPHWVSLIGGTTERHASLDHAINWVEYQHLPDYLRALVDREAPGTAEKNLLSTRPKKKR